MLDLLCYIEDQIIIEGMLAAESSLTPLSNPWMHYDLGLSTKEAELLKSLTINADPPCADCLYFRYYNFADIENLPSELEHQIRSYAENQQNDIIALNIVKLIMRLVNNVLAVSKYSDALVVIKAHKTVTQDDFDDSYTWHRDATIKQRLDIAPNRLSGKIKSSNPYEIEKYQVLDDFKIVESNFIMSLYGPSTLFYGAENFDQAVFGQGTVFISDYDYGAIHSAPKVKNIEVGRIFIAVTPSCKDDILEFAKLF